MKIFISILTRLTFWIVPFIGLNFYLQNFYHLSLSNLVSWNISNLELSAVSLAKLIAFGIIFLLFSFQISCLLNAFYLSLFGRRKSLVFLGYLAKGTAMVYRLEDKQKKVFSLHDPDYEFNYSFNDVNRIREYIKPPLFDESIEMTKLNLQSYAILARLMLAIFFLLPAMALTHALVLPIYKSLPAVDLKLPENLLASFDQVLNLLHLNIVSLALLFLLSLFLAIYFSSKQKEADQGKQVEALPEYIVPGEKILGKPLIVSKVTISRYDEALQKDVAVDTGFRRVAFEFTREFNPPVYVTLKLDTQKHPDVESQIKATIKSGHSMELNLTTKLRIKVLEGEDDTEFELAKEKG